MSLFLHMWKSFTKEVPQGEHDTFISYRSLEDIYRQGERTGIPDGGSSTCKGTEAGSAGQVQESQVKRKGWEEGDGGSQEQEAD